jgi:hypothetical protein
VPDLSSWVREAGRVLKCGGHLVYSDFHPQWSVAGWRRTFRGANHRDYQLPLHPHSIEQHLELMTANGLEVRAIREPKLPGGNRPVVAVFHAVKAGPRSR